MLGVSYISLDNKLEEKIKERKRRVRNESVYRLSVYRLTRKTKQIEGFFREMY